MNSDLIRLLVVAVLGGGLGTSIAQIIRARSEMRRTQAEISKVRPEAESILLGGAERAVASLQAALDRAEHSISRLEAVLAKREERVAELERELATAKGRLGIVQTRLVDFERRVAGLEDDEPNKPSGG